MSRQSAQYLLHHQHWICICHTGPEVQGGGLYWPLICLLKQFPGAGPSVGSSPQPNCPGREQNCLYPVHSGLQTFTKYRRTIELRIKAFLWESGVHTGSVSDKASYLLTFIHKLENLSTSPDHKNTGSRTASGNSFKMQCQITLVRGL